MISEMVFHMFETKIGVPVVLLVFVLVMDVKLSRAAGDWAVVGHPYRHVEPDTSADEVPAIPPIRLAHEVLSVDGEDDRVWYPHLHEYSNK
jgi:hypothetical protein